MERENAARTSCSEICWLQGRRLRTVRRRVGGLLGRPACVHPRGHGTSGVEPRVDLNLLRVTLIPAPSSIRSPRTPSRSTPWSSHVLGRLPSTLVLSSVNHTALSRPPRQLPPLTQPLKPHTLLGHCKVAAKTNSTTHTVNNPGRTHAAPTERCKNNHECKKLAFFGEVPKPPVPHAAGRETPKLGRRPVASSLLAASRGAHRWTRLGNGRATSYSKNQ